MLFRLAFVFCQLLPVLQAAASCRRTCTNDLACRGFNIFTNLKACLRGCCVSRDTALADKRPTSQCIENIEDFANSHSNIFPWLAYIVQTNGHECRFCMGALISTRWVATDFECYEHAGDDEFTTTVFFNIDDQQRRQVFDVVGKSKGGSKSKRDLRFLEIAYAGTDQMRPVATVPMMCDETEIKQAVAVYWSQEGDAGTRRFTTKDVSILPRKDCKRSLKRRHKHEKTSSYYCVDIEGDDTENADELFFNKYAGVPLLRRSASGKHFLIGMFAYSPEDEETTGIAIKIAKRFDAMKERFNATCLNPIL